MTTIMGTICGVIGIGYIAHLINEYRENKSQKEHLSVADRDIDTDNTEDNDKPQFVTSDIMHDALVAIGCQPKKDEEGHMFVD